MQQQSSTATILDVSWAHALTGRPSFVSKEPHTLGLLDRAALADRIAALVTRDPSLLLERYGSLLSAEELVLFDGLSASDYEVRWHLTQLRQSVAQRNQVKKNRRFRCLEELEGKGDFFSDHHMQHRAPALYHQYVGRFLPSERPAAADFGPDCTLSERLLANMDADDAERSRQAAEEAAERFEHQESAEELEEDAEDEEDEEAMAAAVAEVAARREHRVEHSCGKRVRGGRGPSPPGRPAAAVDDGAMEEEASDGEGDYEADGFRVLAQERQAAQEKDAAARHAAGGTAEEGVRATQDAAMAREARMAARAASAREELLRIMRERFIAGEEHEHFDYAGQCDNETRFDDIETMGRDAEERWFDED